MSAPLFGRDTNATEASLSACLSVLKRYLDDDTPTPLDETAKDDIRKALVQLKKGSREVHEQAHLAREAMSELRKTTDGALLGLQSSHYEKKFIERELASILSIPAYDKMEFSSLESQTINESSDAKTILSDRLMRLKTETNVRLSMFICQGF